MKGIRWDREADFLVVGSGAGGATAAVVLSEAGSEVLVLEEGGWYRREDFTEDLYGAMKRMFRDFGGQLARGRSLIPVLEGCCVGGSTVMNGAIIHRLPEAVHAEWCRDRAILRGLPFSELERHASEIEKDLEIRANLAPLLRGLPISHVLERLGWSHRAMSRNAPGCRASGRCLQGCPSGGKLSMEASYLPRTERAGGAVLERHRVERLLLEGGRVVGLVVRDADGKRRALRARQEVVLAAGVVQTPLLLRRSGWPASSQVGRHFQCHLGAGMVAKLSRPVRSVEGPPQGIEVLAFQEEGIKIATQLLPPELLLSRVPEVGRSLSRLAGEIDHLSSWTVHVRSIGSGRVTPGWGGHPSIAFRPGRFDMERVRKGLWRLARLLFELGAVELYPGIAGVGPVLRTADRVDELLGASLDPRAYGLVIGHMFGTCRMGGDPARSVVGPGFKVHGTEGLRVVDASLFPSNIGVNPQHAIMSMARAGAHRILES
jgi:choline dehydrogenase-like flavoprotein